MTQNCPKITSILWIKLLRSPSCFISNLRGPSTSYHPFEDDTEAFHAEANFDDAEMGFRSRPDSESGDSTNFHRSTGEATRC